MSILNINTDNVQIGLVTFSSDPQLQFNLKEFQESSLMTNAIHKVNYEQGQKTNIGASISYVHKKMFIVSNGARPSAPKALILITDGESQDNVNTPSKQLRDDGVTIVCIGIGNSFNRAQLINIATDPSLVFDVKGYDDFYTIRDKVIKKVCTKKMVAM